MASVPEGLEPLKYQTWELKVSIHCEGCKKKAKKVLQGVKGVYSIAIDSKQNKVTVTGDVDVETITRRFRKYGKHVELWPEKKTSSSTNSSCSADADTGAEAKDNEKAAAGPKTEEQHADNEKKKGSEVPPESAAGAIKPAENIVQKTGSGDETAESDKNEAEKPAAPSEDPSDASADGEENKGNHKEVNREESSGDEAANLREAVAGDRAMLPYSSPAYNRPVYTMSYSSSYPSTSNAYYAVPPPATSSVYVHSIHPPPATYLPEYYPPETYYGSMEPPPESAPESYDMFNDENPNACSVM